MNTADPVLTGDRRRRWRRRRAAAPSAAMLIPVVLLSASCSTGGSGTTPSRSPSSASSSSDGSTSVATTGRPATYFIDCAAAGGGTGTWERPWTSPAELREVFLEPGSTVSFKRGCSWEGQVWITGRGTAAQPITVSAHGDGTAPRLRDSDAAGNDAVVTVAAPYTVLSNLHVSGGTSHGVHLQGAHGLVKDVEIERTGFGVRFTGQGSTASNVTVHDLRMFRNTEGGDDDAGAVGFVVEADDVTVERSSCTNCRAESHDYGHDGGFIEIWQRGDRLKILNNRGTNTQGFLEAGAQDGTGSATDVVIRGNVMTECHGGAVNLHTGDKFAITARNVLLERNTFDVTAGGTMFSGNTDALILRNNTLRIGGKPYQPSPNPG